MRKMAKITSVALSALLMAGSLSAFAACGGGAGGTGGGGGESEKPDSKKTQLYVRNYQGGFGNKWLYNGKAKLEEKYKNQRLEDGKMGVQVIIKDIKETPQIANIQNDEHEVYFVEKVQYLYLEKQGVLEDLTDIVTKANPYDNKTIESKLSKEQQEFYGVKDGTETKYYALPHYMAPMGIVYDKDLFEEKGYYFVEGYEKMSALDDKFALKGDTLSAGPDGKSGTSDDGLPATYADFWDLCERIYTDSMLPLNWGGMNGASFYITALMIQLQADYMGKTDYMKNFTMEGELSELVKLDSEGKIVMGTDGLPETETVTLDPETNNGYEPFRHISYYYALDFLKTMMDNIGKYAVAENMKTTSYDAFKAQSDYVSSRFSSKSKRQAMLIEGSWWENEATKYFESNEIVYKDAAKKENCNYGWMPLPRANEENVGKHNATMVNTISSLCFVKKGLPEMKKQLAFDFVQLMNSDESLVDFTLTTNAFKDFNYDLTPAQVETLTPFGQNLYDCWKSYDIINPHNANDQYYNTIYTTDSSRRYSISTVNVFPANTFLTDNTMTVAKYFEQTYSYKRENIKSWN